MKFCFYFQIALEIRAPKREEITLSGLKIFLSIRNHLKEANVDIKVPNF